MTETIFSLEKRQEPAVHEVRGYVMSSREMKDAARSVEAFMETDQAKELFTDSERVYAEIALGLVDERGQTLRDNAERGMMGPAFVDAYRHISGIRAEEQAAANPDRAAIAQLSDAYEVGELAGAKVSALLGAAWQKRDLGTAVDYIKSDEFAAEHKAEESALMPETQAVMAVFDSLSPAKQREFAAAAFKNLFGD